jgi:hypothetical protein
LDSFCLFFPFWFHSLAEESGNFSRSCVVCWQLLVLCRRSDYLLFAGLQGGYSLALRYQIDGVKIVWIGSKRR